MKEVKGEIRNLGGEGSLLMLRSTMRTVSVRAKCSADQMLRPGLLPSKSCTRPFPKREADGSSLKMKEQHAGLDDGCEKKALGRQIKFYQQKYEKMN